MADVGGVVARVRPNLQDIEAEPLPLVIQPVEIHRAVVDVRRGDMMHVGDEVVPAVAGPMIEVVQPLRRALAGHIPAAPVARHPAVS